MVYKTEAGKFNAVLEEIEDCHRRGQPVLMGTVSIEKSEHLSVAEAQGYIASSAQC